VSALGTAELAEALETARTVVGEAAALLAGAAGAARSIRSKSNLRDLVTEWDTRSEDLIRERLGRLTPQVPILGEEGGASGAGDGELRWLVDPIDGTVNFAHGIPLFAVTVALEERGQPVVGVVSAPALGWEFYAARGGGAFRGDDALAVSEVAAIERAILASGFPYDRATTSYNFAEWEHFQRTAGACRRFGAASLDLCMVACGWLDGYWESRLQPWDVSAGALLVSEAGGRVTDYRGGPFESASGEAIASNGRVHEAIVRELAAVAARR